MTSRQKADARKRIRRACDGLVAAGLLVRVGVGWTLPPETPEEAKARRRVTRTSERQEHERIKREADSSWLKELLRPSPIDRATRAKLVKILGLLGSRHNAEVVVAARRAERLRTELGCSWSDLLTESSA